jgi:hypothetical protein
MQGAITRHLITRIPVVALLVAASCGGGGASSGNGSFRLLQFLEAGQNNIPRNRVLTFLFSAPVAEGQDFAERLKIENTQGNPGSNFSLAIGTYDVVGDRVTFAPRLPNKQDRSDAGFRENGEYTVFLKGGPDALRSTGGDPIARQQELLFDTNEYFEDPLPAEPPRVMGLFARDPTQLPTAPRVDLSRLDPRPTELALLDNAALIDAGRYLEPGAGGAPNYATRWQLELEISEPVDPLTVTKDNVQMFEIYSDATTSGDAAPPAAPSGYYGTPVSYKVPIQVSVQQKFEGGQYDVKILVQPLETLVDNTRYRLTFSGTILGIDFRDQFIGVNGLTGDGQTVVSGATPYPEPGGLGYTAEFIVRDRPAIQADRMLTYDPLVDGIHPELGQTTNDKALWNTALYNPASGPGTAVGYLAAFGNGTDGSLAVSNGTLTIDTGDTPNDPVGKPFQVFDLNPNDEYNDNTLPGGLRTYDSRKPLELNLDSLTVSTGAVLRFVGVNPVLLRVTGIAQISGKIDLAGGDGQNGKNGNVVGGTAGPGGGDGGRSNRGPSCTLAYVTYQSCSSSTFAQAMSAGCGGGWPWSLNGDGPGRGQAGGCAFGYMYYSPTAYEPQSGTGGGGGSRATKGTAGEDKASKGAAPGSAGNCTGSYYMNQNSGVVGVRGEPGPVHGDPELFDITWGGSGGGAGGATTEYYTYGDVACGGSGGGGGGMFTLASAGAILCDGGIIDCSGGDGGAGGYGQYAWYGTYGYYHLSGGGGGGSGGGICLISGDNISATNAMFDVTGGKGGAAPNNPTNNSTNNDAGGDGGKGFIYLMDADGVVPGLLPGTSGSYAGYGTGYLTIAPLSAGANRFGEIRAITELYNVFAANPAYLEIDPQNDVLASVSQNQEILLYASTAKADPLNPLQPDIVTEIAPVLVARVHYAFGATQVDTFNAMSQLNPAGPDRDAFVRVNALFNYGNIVEAALGPFAYMDGFDIRVSFNG